MVTNEEFTEITGILPPSDLKGCVQAAKGMLDARTLCFYSSTYANNLPKQIDTVFKQYLAFQALFISENGGVASAYSSNFSSQHLGDFSFTKGVGDKAHSKMASVYLPILIGYASCQAI